MSSSGRGRRLRRDGRFPPGARQVHGATTVIHRSSRVGLRFANPTYGMR